MLFIVNLDSSKEVMPGNVEYICSEGDGVGLCVSNSKGARTYLYLSENQNQCAPIDEHIARVFPGQHGTYFLVTEDQPLPPIATGEAPLYDVTSYLPPFITNSVMGTANMNCHYASLYLTGVLDGKPLNFWHWLHNMRYVDSTKLPQYLEAEFQLDQNDCRTQYGSIIAYARTQKNGENRYVHSAWHLFGDIVFHKRGMNLTPSAYDEGIERLFEWASIDTALQRTLIKSKDQNAKTSSQNSRVHCYTKSE